MTPWVGWLMHCGAYPGLFLRCCHVIVPQSILLSVVELWSGVVLQWNELTQSVCYVFTVPTPLIGLTLPTTLCNILQTQSTQTDCMHAWLQCFNSLI